MVSLAAMCLISYAQDEEKEWVSEQLGHGYDFEGNGKDQNGQKQNFVYQLWPTTNQFNETLKSNVDETIKALTIQKNFLKSRNNIHSFENLSFSDDKLAWTVNTLIELITEGEQSQKLNFYRLAGEDNLGNVHFTAYYTLVLEARNKKDSIHKYPIYKLPKSWKSLRPTRTMIDEKGVLKDQGLELAWTTSLLDNYFLQVQGSGYLKFEDGSHSLLLFEGQNGYSYTSIGKYMVKQGYIEASNISLPAIREWFDQNPDSLHAILNLNESYAFFEISQKKIKGAANTELVPGHSIAVDPKYIPYGAVLLAKIPILNEMGELEKHEYRLLTAQDRGGAIKGPGHIDLYEGVGDVAEKKAGSLHHYGTLWLILIE
jgi:membrane-bound lytic murein transglycosylase A